MRSAQREYDRAMADYDSAMAEREVKYQEKVTAKKGIRRFAAMGVAGALLLIALVALVLCLLGIERNTRALEKIIASQMNQNN
jgi:nitrogen fixation/metabolism regulation signal transduction histidine kinase